MIQKLFALLTLLVGILAVFFVFVFKPAEKKLRPANPEGHLAAAVPADIGKWHGKEKPLADKEEVLRATESVLQLNEFLNRTYTDPNGREFSLYIAYWAQGKVPTRFSSIHIPDRCWTKSGWTNISSHRKFGEELSIDGKTFQSLTARKFEFEVPNSKDPVIRYVWYWFIIEGDVLAFKTPNARIANPLVYFKNMWHESTKGIPEQYLVRLDSAIPIDELYKDGDFKEMLKYLGELILYKKDEK